MTNAIERMAGGVGGMEVRVEESADGKKVLTGYAAVFYDGTPATEYKLWRDTVERIMPGAFDKVLASKPDTRGLFNHDSDNVLGRTRSGTLRMSVDSKGLRYEIDPPPTTFAADVLALVEREDVDGSSFGFTVAAETWRKDADRKIEVRELVEIGRLFDVGPVTFPAYAGTTAEAGARSDEGEPASLVALRAIGDTSEARASWERWRDKNLRLDRDLAEAAVRLASLRESGTNIVV